MLSSTTHLADLLRIAVPGFYLLAAIYLAAFVDGTADLKYIVVFATIGAGGWMVLNEPEFGWIPPWITPDIWVVVTLLGVLAAGIWLLAIAITKQGLKWPWELAREGGQSLREHVNNR